MSATMSVPDLAKVLFATALQASEEPSPDQVRTAIECRLRACRAGHADCAVYVAQEAGDHPDTYVVRMRWALDTVVRAYPVLPATTPPEPTSTAA
jgi:hypothetical protein